MKKTLAIILALVMMLLCFSGCARNQKTYYTDKENFEMKLFPNNKEGDKVASGTNSIQIVTNTPNVENGNGEVAIYKSSDDSLIAKYDVRMDSNSIYINKSTSPAFAQIIICIPEDKCFESGETYYVTMDEKCFYIDDIKGFNGVVEKGDWEFTIADYGFDGNIADVPITYLVGDTIELPIKLGDKAKTAVLLYDNLSAVSSDYRALNESGKFELKAIGEGTTTISVMFLEEDGKYIETLGFTVTIK